MTLPPKREKNSNLLLSFSPWMLAVACTLLVLLQVIFTVNNYRREKELMGEALVQKGLTLMRFVSSSARETMRDNLRSGETMLGWERARETVAVETPATRATS